MNYAMLLQILIEAEYRVSQYIGTEFNDVAERSTETVSFCKERMAKEGLTRDQLEKLAKVAPSSPVWS
jgi:predicted transcriptional regulator